MSERVFKVEGESIQLVYELLAELNRRGDLRGVSLEHKPWEMARGKPIVRLTILVDEGVEVEIPGVPEYVEPEVSQENPTPTTKPGRGRK